VAPPPIIHLPGVHPPRPRRARPRLRPPLGRTSV